MLFLLKPITPWGKYNMVDSLVVRASTAVDARQIAATAAEFEGPEAWLSEATTSCEPLEQDGPAEVICRDSSGA